MKKVLSILCILLVLSGIVFAGGAGESGKKKVVMWCAYSQPGRIEAMDNAIAKFEAENPDIDVVRELVPWANIVQKWITSKMSGTLPNLVVGTDSDLIRMWDAGDLEPMNSVVDMIGGPEAFNGTVLESFKVGDDYIAVPHYTLSWKLVIRADWLEELGFDVPETWDELYEVAVAMYDPPNRYGFDLPMNKSAFKAKEWMINFARTNDAYFFDADGNVTFNSPEMIETVKFVLDLYQDSGRPAAINYSDTDCIDNYANGTCGMVFATGTMLEQVEAIDPTVLENSIVIDTPYKKHPGVPEAGPIGIGKFKGVDNSEEADKFLAFLFNDLEVYTNFILSMSGQIPSTVKGAEDPVYLNSPLVAKYPEMNAKWFEGAMTGIKINQDFGLTPRGSAVCSGSEIEDMFQSIIVDGVSVEDAVAATAEAMVNNLTAAGYPPPGK